ncbi:hypothetical protein R1sor_007756 [Riccia sorocarpa]|uniref:Cytochrome P450 n=1 Tax=Riccia sorocarpa TaxID=122646 RepID=A0ABD3HV01_9MARC
MELRGAVFTYWPDFSDSFPIIAFQQWFPALVISVLLISSFSLLTWRKWSAPCGEGSRQHLPPNPLTTFPLVGNLLQLLTTDKAYYRFTEELLAKWGPVILPRTASSRYLSFGGNGLAIGPYGEHWEFLRSIYTQRLLSPKKYPLFSKIRTEELDLFVRSVMKHQKGNNPIYVNLSKKIVEISLNMITMMMVGSRSCPYGDIRISDKVLERNYSEKEIGDMRGRGPDWREYSCDITKLFFSPLLEDAIPRLAFVDKLTGRRERMKRARERLRELYQDLIRDRKERRQKQPTTEEDTTFLDTLLDMAGRRGASSLSEETIMGLLQVSVNTLWMCYSLFNWSMIMHC